jgi:hypothetical protein
VRSTAPRASFRGSPSRARYRGGRGAAEPSGASGGAGVSADRSELQQYVRLPVEPRSVLWQRRARGTGDSRVPGPTDWSVVCVLELADGDLARLAWDGAAGQPRTKRKVQSQDWFPRAVASHADKDGLIEGDALDAGAFFKPPFLNGVAVRVGTTSYVVLGLYTT